MEFDVLFKNSLHSMIMPNVSESLVGLVAIIAFILFVISAALVDGANNQEIMGAICIVFLIVFIGAAFSLVNIYIVLGLIIVTIAVWGVKSIWWGIEYKIEERKKSRKASGN